MEISKAAFDAANVVLFAAILVGVALHARRKLHVRCMTACFVGDVLMVVLIELQRHAVKTTVRQFSGAPDANALLQFHIAVSVAALAMWVVQIVSGRRVLRGAPSVARHRRGAWIFLTLRATNVVTAYLLPDPV
jgi:hypothetical protein